MLIRMLAVLAALGSSARGQTGHGSDDGREGAGDVVVIRSTTDVREASGLLNGFRARYPNIRVDYEKLNSVVVNEEFLDAAAAGGLTGDILWSSAMDLQMKLVNDGYAQPYESPEAEGLPPWAKWRNTAYGITAEPVAIVYNRNLLPASRVPYSHLDLERGLTTAPEAWQGRIVTFDPEHSGTGFLFLTRDLQENPRTWDLVRAMGQVGVKLYTASDAMIDRVANGDALLAYNVLGSYALERARENPALGVVLPTDYTIVISRIAFIPKLAPHPVAARLFMDYLLSRDGQFLLAASSLMPVREDARGGLQYPIGNSARPVRIGPELLTWLDQIKQRQFLHKWRHAQTGG